MATDTSKPDRKRELIQTQPQPDGLEMKMVSDPATLGPVRRQVEKFAREAGFSDGVAEGVGLAVNEAMANVIRHQYRGATDKPMQVNLRRLTIAVTESGVAAIEIAIRDWGTPFDPSRLPWAKTVEHANDTGNGKPEGHSDSIDLDQLKPGGLGLLCMKKLMDEVTFEPQPDGMLLRLTKKLPGKQAR